MLYITCSRVSFLLAWILCWITSSEMLSRYDLLNKPIYSIATELSLTLLCHLIEH